ncbi:protein ABHD14B-like [Haliotis rubra]|uniref:protein ABHD14B-like n=1 Tax=Haliotis rubra TaxID=36100 RepID=UPI001EE5FA1E|nr:protein ABHD14B-like [Haliotis rubra]
MAGKDESKEASWYTQFVDIPADVKSAGNDQVKEVVVEVSLNGKSLKIFTRQADPQGSATNVDVLFLHGQSFTSENWLDIGTLSLVSSWGHRGVAVDLPGYGSTKDVIDDGSHGAFLGALVKALKMTRPVVVSPSMSGGFSLPFLFDQPETAEDRSRGYLPVAPVATSKYTEAYSKSKIPTMIVYGENDTNLGTRSLKDLIKLPNSKPFVIPEAGHAAYMNNPPFFHRLLYNFLNIIAAYK